MTVVAENQSPQIPLTTVCRFCELATHETPITESKIGFTVPSFGALVQGWLLAIPRRHIVALTDLMDWERKEFRDLMDEAENLVGAKYGRPIMFEHGPAGDGRNAGCGIDHAHLHIVPITLMLHETVISDGEGRNLRWRPAARPWDAHAEHSAGLDYFFVRESDGTAWVAGTPGAPSQLLRRAIAEHVGSAVWDWNEDFRHDLVAATYRQLLKSNKAMS